METAETGAHEVHGTIYENSFEFLMIVTGETTESFVRHVEGAIHGDKMYGVFQDSHDSNGSFVAWRQQ